MASTNQPPAYIPSSEIYLKMLTTLDIDIEPIIERVAIAVADEFAHRMDTQWKAMGIKKTEPVERLSAFLLWDDARWQEERVSFPQDFEEDWNDFERLRTRAKDGDFGDEFKALTIEYEQIHGIAA